MSFARVSADPQPNIFHYQIRPSAFKIAEAPTYLCWKAVKGELWRADNIQNEWLKKAAVTVLRIGGYAGGFVALPITVCLTPVTLVADIVVGVVECLFCLYRGSRKEDVLMIAHRKFLVSPIQHFTFSLSALAALWAVGILFTGLIISPLAIKSGLVFWTLGYAVGQTAVGKLPQGINHRTFNIFIGGGSGERENGERWIDDQEQPPRHAEELPREGRGPAPASGASVFSGQSFTLGSVFTGPAFNLG